MASGCSYSSIVPEMEKGERFGDGYDDTCRVALLYAEIEGRVVVVVACLLDQPFQEMPLTCALSPKLQNQISQSFSIL